MTAQATAPAKTEYRSEYGQRWNRLTPRREIAWLVSKWSVGMPNEEVAEKIRTRCQNAALKDARFTARIIEESVRYALVVHGRNRDLYRRVARGM